jgi:CBS domain-containing protein/hemerythrin-like domain-containing protein
MACRLLRQDRMARLRSCEGLRQEHELIGQVLAGMESLARLRRAGAVVPNLTVTGAIEFFTAFVSRCHDAKESEALFPVLVRHEALSGGLVETLEADHQEGCRLLDVLHTLSLRHRLDAEAWGLIEAYLTLLRRHIASEDAGLFPLAERTLSTEEDAAVERAFEEIEERVVGHGGREALVALAAAVAHASEHPGDESPPSAKEGEMAARRIMRARPATVRPDDTLARAAETMNRLGTREVPVVAGSTLVGILCRTDMEPHRGHYEWTPVRAAMTANPVTVTADMPIRVVARLMLGRGFNTLPVVDGTTLVGAISRADLLRVISGEPST